MIAYEWEVLLYNTSGADVSAKHCGISGTEEQAIKHVEQVMRTDKECAIGVVYSSVLVYSAARALSFMWIPSQNAAKQYCTRTVRGGCRWIEAREGIAI
jgi:hypothetical protein